MRLQTTLHVIDPTALCPPAEQASDAQALALLELLCGRDPRVWSRELAALYHADDPCSAALARALADRAWLRPRILLPVGLPAEHWAGVLDQLGRQHAGAGVMLVAPQETIASAAIRLECLARAIELAEPAPGVRQLALVTDVARRAAR